MGQPTYEFDYEIRYRGKVKITAANPEEARKMWHQLSIPNLITIAGAPLKNLLNVSSGHPPVKY